MPPEGATKADIQYKQRKTFRTETLYGQMSSTIKEEAENAEKTLVGCVTAELNDYGDRLAMASKLFDPATSTSAVQLASPAPEPKDEDTFEACGRVFVYTRQHDVKQRFHTDAPPGAIGELRDLAPTLLPHDAGKDRLFSSIVPLEKSGRSLDVKLAGCMSEEIIRLHVPHG